MRSLGRTILPLAIALGVLASSTVRGQDARPDTLRPDDKVPLAGQPAGRALDREQDRIPAPPAEDLADLVVRLDSTDVQTRLDATERLAKSPAITLKQLETVLRAGPLSLEQRCRLLAAARRRFISEPRAGMGIQPDINFGQHGVGLAGIQQDFPASKVLRPGDRIVSADGVPIDTWETIRAVIISRDPGDEIPVSIVRDGGTLNVTVKLGEFARLRQAGIDSGLLEDAWILRSRSLQDPAKAPVIESGLPVAAWAQSGLLDDEAAEIADAAARANAGDDTGSGLVAGGEARGGIPGRQIRNAGMRTFSTRLAPPQPPINLPGNQIGGADAANAQIREQQIQNLQAQRDQLVNQLILTNQRLVDPTTGEAARRTLRLRAETLTEEIRFRDLQIQALQAQHNVQPRR